MCSLNLTNIATSQLKDKYFNIKFKWVSNMSITNSNFHRLDVLL